MKTHNSSVIFKKKKKSILHFFLLTCPVMNCDSLFFVLFCFFHQRLPDTKPTEINENFSTGDRGNWL